MGLISRLKRLNYRHVLPDIALITLSIYASLFLRLGWSEIYTFLPLLDRHLALVVAIRIGTFICVGVYDIIWRYISLSDAVRLVRAVVISSILIIAASYLVDIGRLPRAIFFIDAVLVATLLCGVRFARRLIYEGSTEREVKRSGKLTLIYGAGASGRILANRCATDSRLGLNLVGFIDDNPQKVGRYVSGIEVMGTGKDLTKMIQDYKIKQVLVAIAAPPGDLLRDVVQACRSAGAQSRLFTAATTDAQNRNRLDLFRDIGLEDLLNRPSIQIDNAALRDLIQNRRVLVTGAGGSIGSELARQILGHNPSLLLLLDHSEFNLYQVDQELRQAPGDSSLVIPLLGDIKNREVLRNMVREYSPELVFHAAAYKHVHLVEANPFTSILNNVLGTRNLLDCCLEQNVGTFVLISTDKAVNPAGVMGATKRICELMVSRVGEQTGRRYTSVRFGNVLGSSGSLIPLLKKQIENGEPVTITHQDMTRYFMLIPEAVSLVLKAATIAQPGDITILRMGEPLKIVDIAQSLIALMGKTADEVPMVFTGLRPGEKMFEELYLCGNEIETSHPDILVLPRGDGLEAGAENLGEKVDHIIQLAEIGNKEALYIMSALVKLAVREAPTPPAAPEARLFSNSTDSLDGPPLQ